MFQQPDRSVSSTPAVGRSPFIVACDRAFLPEDRMRAPHNVRHLSLLLLLRSCIAGLACIAVLFVVSRPAAEGKPAAEPETIFAAARAAIADGRLTRSEVLGFDLSKRRYNELPSEGGILIGFDAGVGKFIGIDTVYALRPIYQTAHGDTSGGDLGLFADRHSGKKGIKSKVVRRVQVRAREGYAVGGITIRSGLNINGFCVQFMRIHGRELDPLDSYTSKWVGDRTGGHEKSLSGNGDPVLGVFGGQDEVHVQSLGLLFMKRPPKPVKPPEPPKVEQPAGAPRAEQHAAPAQAPYDELTETIKGMQKDIAARLKMQRELAARVPAVMSTQQQPVARHQDGQPASGTSWLPVIIFGGVTGIVFVVLLAIMSLPKLLAARAPARGVTQLAPREPVGKPGRRRLGLAIAVVALGLQLSVVGVTLLSSLKTGASGDGNGPVTTNAVEQLAELEKTSTDPKPALMAPGLSQTAKGKKHALVVGVRGYHSVKLRKLDYTENDAEELAEELQNKGGFSVRVLTTSRGKKSKADRPTLANLRAEIRVLLAKKKRHDMVLVALAGHGIQATVKDKEESFFCPADAQFNDNDTLLSLGKLFADLDDCGAAVKLLLVDACRNDPKLGRNVDVDSLPRLPHGTAVLFSCKSGERAFESPRLGKKGHGVFFHYVLEGLRGKAKNEHGEVTWARLAEFVTEKVSEEVPTLIGEGAKQTPELKVSLTGKSPVLVGVAKEE
jgi:hypothetical protein